jgi:hypothetical protein
VEQWGLEGQSCQISHRENSCIICSPSGIPRDGLKEAANGAVHDLYAPDLLLIEEKVLDALRLNVKTKGCGLVGSRLGLGGSTLMNGRSWLGRIVTGFPLGKMANETMRALSPLRKSWLRQCQGSQRVDATPSSK